MPKHNPQAYKDSMQMHAADLQQPGSVYSQHDQNKTLSYVERKDAQLSKEAKQLQSQAYKGRYS